MSRLKKAGNSVFSDLSAVPRLKQQSEAQPEEVDPEKYHVTAAGRKFLIEQGQKSLFSKFPCLIFV